MAQDKKSIPRLDETNIRSFVSLRETTMAQVMKATKELHDRGQGLRAQMLAAASERCQDWLLESGALDDLLAYGSTCKKCGYDETCGLGMNAETVRATLRALSAAWHDQVAITIVSEEPHRIMFKLQLPR